MINRETLRKYIPVLGPLTFAVFVVGVSLAASANPWWSLYRNAFSDLGGPRASRPWIFNWTLILSGILFAIYSLGVLLNSRSHLDSFSAGLLFTAGIFLTLIGVYPSGTRPHTFVSTWFYIQSYLGISTLGLSKILQERKVLGLTLLLLGALPIPLAYLIDRTVGWPSIALLELAGALFILASSIVYMLTVRYPSR